MEKKVEKNNNLEHCGSVCSIKLFNYDNGNVFKPCLHFMYPSFEESSKRIEFKNVFTLIHLIVMSLKIFTLNIVYVQDLHVCGM